MDIGNIRKRYRNKEDIFSSTLTPVQFFKQWYLEAEKKVSEPNAFALSTSYKGVPSSRMMLLKNFSASFTFYTNISSRKGRDIVINKNASMLFWWKEIQRQVRIEGELFELSKATVKKYFYSRPIDSQIGALSSNQSSKIISYEMLVNEFAKNKLKFKNRRIPFPENWTGFQLRPTTIEFWQGGEDRLHQRIEYRKNKNKWKSRILAP